MTILEFINEHFWAMWWLVVIISLNLPDAIVKIVKHERKAASENANES